MKRTRKLVLALSASVVLALGATAPAFAGKPTEGNPPRDMPGTVAEAVCEASEDRAPWCPIPPPE